MKIYLVASLKPVANKQREVASRGVIGNRNARPLVDIERTVPTSGSVHRRRREVGKSPNLILGLKLVGEVGARRNGAVCAKNSILSRVLPLLDPVPSYEERLVELVDHVDDDVVVCHAVESRPRELSVDENNLQKEEDPLAKF